MAIYKLILSICLIFSELSRTPRSSQLNRTSSRHLSEDDIITQLISGECEQEENSSSEDDLEELLAVDNFDIPTPGGYQTKENNSRENSPNQKKCDLSSNKNTEDRDEMVFHEDDDILAGSVGLHEISTGLDKNDPQILTNVDKNSDHGESASIHSSTDAEENVNDVFSDVEMMSDENDEVKKANEKRNKDKSSESEIATSGNKQSVENTSMDKSDNMVLWLTESDSENSGEEMSRNLSASFEGSPVFKKLRSSLEIKNKSGFKKLIKVAVEEKMSPVKKSKEKSNGDEIGKSPNKKDEASRKADGKTISKGDAADKREPAIKETSKLVVSESDGSFHTPVGSNRRVAHLLSASDRSATPDLFDDSVSVEECSVYSPGNKPNISGNMPSISGSTPNLTHLSVQAVSEGTPVTSREYTDENLVRKDDFQKTYTNSEVTNSFEIEQEKGKFISPVVKYEDLQASPVPKCDELGSSPEEKGDNLGELSGRSSHLFSDDDEDMLRICDEYTESIPNNTANTGENVGDNTSARNDGDEKIGSQKEREEVVNKCEKTRENSPFSQSRGEIESMKYPTDSHYTSSENVMGARNSPEGKNVKNSDKFKRTHDSAGVRSQNISHGATAKMAGKEITQNATSNMAAVAGNKDIEDILVLTPGELAKLPKSATPSPVFTSQLSHRGGSQEGEGVRNPARRLTDSFNDTGLGDEMDFKMEVGSEKAIDQNLQTRKTKSPSKQSNSSSKMDGVTVSKNTQQPKRKFTFKSQKSKARSVQQHDLFGSDSENDDQCGNNRDSMKTTQDIQQGNRASQSGMLGSGDDITSHGDVGNTPRMSFANETMLRYNVDIFQNF